MGSGKVLLMETGPGGKPYRNICRLSPDKPCAQIIIYFPDSQEQQSLLDTFGYWSGNGLLKKQCLSQRSLEEQGDKQKDLLSSTLVLQEML